MPPPEGPESRWIRLRSLFDAADAVLPAEREALLKGLAGDDTSLVAEVIELLRAREDVGSADLAAGCQAALATATESVLPDRIGPYRVLTRLGEGGMGVVYQAEEIEPPHRPVALKVVQTHLDTPHFLERFLREAQLAARIDHPHCVFVLGGGEVGGQPFVAMELLSGRSLATLVRERGPLPTTEAVRLMLDVCDGLQAIHDADIVHRDIKPSNCLLTEDGRVKVSDFGLSGTRPEVLRPDEQLERIGTLAFAAPEQLRGEPVDVRADVYGASATLHFLLTGEPPTTSATGGPTTATIQRPADTDITKLLQRGLAANANERHADIAALRVEIAALDPPAPEAASYLQRSAAFLVDWMLLEFLFGCANFVWPEARLIEAGFDSAWGTWLVLIRNALAVVYFALLEGSFAHASLGKALLGITLQRADERAPVGLVRAGTRTLLFMVVLACGELTTHALIAAIGWLGDYLVAQEARFAIDSMQLAWQLGGIALTVTAQFAPTALLFVSRRTPRRQGWHDRLTRTTVVQRRRSETQVRGPSAVASLDWANATIETDPFLQRRVMVVDAELPNLRRPTSPRLVDHGQRHARAVAMLALPPGATWSEWLASGCGTWPETCLVLGSLIDEVEADIDEPDAVPLDERQLLVGHGGRLFRLPMPPRDATERPIEAASWLQARLSEVVSARGDAMPWSALQELGQPQESRHLEGLRSTLASTTGRNTTVSPTRRAAAAWSGTILLLLAAMQLWIYQRTERNLSLYRVCKAALDLETLSTALTDPRCRAALLDERKQSLETDWRLAFGASHTFALMPTPQELEQERQTLQQAARALAQQAQLRWEDYWRTLMLDEGERTAALHLLTHDYDDTRPIIDLKSLHQSLDRRGAGLGKDLADDGYSWTTRTLALLWTFHMLALDGNPVAAPQLRERVKTWDFSRHRCDWPGVIPADWGPVWEVVVREGGFAGSSMSDPLVPWWPTICLAVASALAWIQRGQWALRLAGLALVDARSRILSRWRAAARTAIALLPIWLLCGAAEWIDRIHPRGGLVCGMLYQLAFAALLLHPVLAYRFPRRWPQDVVMGTRVVPW